MGDEQTAKKSSRKMLMLLEAYTARKALVDANEKVLAANKSKKIMPNAPIREVEKSKIHVVENKWWVKEPCLAGEAMNKTHGRLSDVKKGFTYISKKRLDHSAKLVSGDFLETSSSPQKAKLMMMNRSYSELNIPTRSADFNSSVEFHLSLRSGLY